MIVQNLRPNRKATFYDNNYNILADFDNFFIMLTDESDTYSKEQKGLMSKTHLKELFKKKRDLFIRGVYTENSPRLTNANISQYTEFIFAYQDINGEIKEFHFIPDSINIYNTGIVNIKVPKINYYEEL